MLDEYQEGIIAERFTSAELADFLQINSLEFVLAALDEGWINDDNIEDLLEFADLREDYEDE